MLKATFLMLFRPSCFEKLATKQEIGKLSNEWRDRHNCQPPVERLHSKESMVHEQTSSIRCALKRGILTTSLTILLGTILGFIGSMLYGPPSEVCIYLLQALGAAMTLGATLGEVGRKVSTIDGNTLAESVNAFLFNANCTVGTFLFALSASWDAFA